MHKLLSILIGSLFAAAAPSHAAAPLCSVLKTADLGRILGQPVVSSEYAKGIPSEACTYSTAPGPGGASMFILTRYLMPIPAGQVRSLLMSTGPGDNYVPVPALGSDAVMNTGVQELVFRKGPTVYHLIARGVACERKPGEERTAQRAACDKKRIAILTAAAALLP